MEKYREKKNFPILCHVAFPLNSEMLNFDMSNKNIINSDKYNLFSYLQKLAYMLELYKSLVKI
jgi:hypothetical protein